MAEAILSQKNAVKAIVGFQTLCVIFTTVMGLNIGWQNGLGVIASTWPSILLALFGVHTKNNAALVLWEALVIFGAIYNSWYCIWGTDEVMSQHIGYGTAIFNFVYLGLMAFIVDGWRRSLKLKAD